MTDLLFSIVRLHLRGIENLFTFRSSTLISLKPSHFKTPSPKFSLTPLILQKAGNTDTRTMESSNYKLGI